MTAISINRQLASVSNLCTSIEGTGYHYKIVMVSGQKSLDKNPPDINPQTKTPQTKPPGTNFVNDKTFLP